MSSLNKKEKIPGKSFITRSPFPKSKKIYVKGKIHDIEVSMREIETDDKISNSENLKLTLYDTSGPYTDSDIDIDIHKGIPKIRSRWIKERNDVEYLGDFTSDYAKRRLINSNGITFKHINKPLRAKNGQNVTQMHYAKKGIITPEMEY
ncbi:MAG: phosphomethylpyrimidine synthase ThiC, partial [Thermodesulfobacteriota bacterium]